MKSLRGYISSRKFMGEQCHHSTQNLVLRDYCLKLNCQYLLSGTEYSIKDSYMTLQLLIDEIPKINGIVAYSLFQMPESQKHRLKIYEEILEKKGELHFALEGLKVTVSSEIERIENIWLIRQVMPKCYNPA